MQIEMSPDDMQEFQKAVMATAVGRAMLVAVNQYLASDYKLNSVVEDVLKQEVRAVAREVLEKSDKLKAKIRDKVMEQIDDDVIEKAANAALSRY